MDRLNYSGTSLPQQLTCELLQTRDHGDIQRMLQDQDDCLQMYKSSQQNLDAFNEFSKARYNDVHKHFQVHTKLLREMKTDLDSIYLKLRKIKAHLEQKYPEETASALQQYPPLPPTEND